MKKEGFKLGHLTKRLKKQEPKEESTERGYKRRKGNGEKEGVSKPFV